MNYAAHVGEDAAHRCALHLDKVPNGTIQLCHIIPRAEHANNLQMLERAWQLPEGSFSQETRWAQIYLCSNYHWGFDHGGWSFLPDMDVLSSILSAIEGEPEFTGHDAYEYWLSEVKRLRKSGAPPKYSFIPLQTLDDQISIGRLNLETPIVNGHHKYDYINAPYHQIKISLPLHPFPVIAHFMKSWQMLDAEFQQSIKGRLKGLQKMLIVAAEAIWECWCAKSEGLNDPHNWTIKHAGHQDDGQGSGGGNDYDDGDGEDDGNAGGRGEDHEAGGRAPQNAQPGHGADPNQLGGVLATTAGRTLVDSRAMDIIPKKIKAIVACPPSGDVPPIAGGLKRSRSTTPSDFYCSCCPPSADVEVEESEDEDYNPLPEYAPQGQTDISVWAASVEDGEDSVRGRVKSQARLRTSAKRDRTLEAYALEKARSPPRDPDWKKWEADTHRKWNKVLRPLKRRKTTK